MSKTGKTVYKEVPPGSKPAVEDPMAPPDMNRNPMKGNTTNDPTTDYAKGKAEAEKLKSQGGVKTSGYINKATGREWAVTDEGAKSDPSSPFYTGDPKDSPLYIPTDNDLRNDARYKLDPRYADNPIVHPELGPLADRNAGRKVVGETSGVRPEEPAIQPRTTRDVKVVNQAMKDAGRHQTFVDKYGGAILLVSAGFIGYVLWKRNNCSCDDAITLPPDGTNIRGAIGTSVDSSNPLQIGNMFNSGSNNSGGKGVLSTIAEQTGKTLRTGLKGVGGITKIGAEALKESLVKIVKEGTELGRSEISKVGDLMTDAARSAGILVNDAIRADYDDFIKKVGPQIALRMAQNPKTYVFAAIYLQYTRFVAKNIAKLLKDIYGQDEQLKTDVGKKLAEWASGLIGKQDITVKKTESGYVATFKDEKTGSVVELPTNIAPPTDEKAGIFDGFMEATVKYANNLRTAIGTNLTEFSTWLSSLPQQQQGYEQIAEMEMESVNEEGSSTEYAEQGVFEMVEGQIKPILSDLRKYLVNEIDAGFVISASDINRFIAIWKQSHEREYQVLQDTPKALIDLTKLTTEMQARVETRIMQIARNVVEYDMRNPDAENAVRDELEARYKDDPTNLERLRVAISDRIDDFNRLADNDTAAPINWVIEQFADYGFTPEQANEYIKLRREFITRDIITTGKEARDKKHKEMKKQIESDMLAVAAANSVESANKLIDEFKKSDAYKYAAEMKMDIDVLIKKALDTVKAKHPSKEEQNILQFDEPAESDESIGSDGGPIEEVSDEEDEDLAKRYKELRGNVPAPADTPAKLSLSELFEALNTVNNIGELDKLAEQIRQRLDEMTDINERTNQTKISAARILAAGLRLKYWGIFKDLLEMGEVDLVKEEVNKLAASIGANDTYNNDDIQSLITWLGHMLKQKDLEVTIKTAVVARKIRYQSTKETAKLAALEQEFGLGVKLEDIISVLGNTVPTHIDVMVSNIVKAIKLGNGYDYAEKYKPDTLKSMIKSAAKMLGVATSKIGAKKQTIEKTTKDYITDFYNFLLKADNIQTLTTLLNYVKPLTAT